MPVDHLRFHRPHHQLHNTFGAGGFGKQAEAFARFFGTPGFLIGQTIVVAIWIGANVVGVASRWDPYPFILLNLVFSLQAAYAAPLILLAQTRQADRERALSDADAQHREALAQASLERNEIAVKQGESLQKLLLQNTHLTEQSARLTEQVEQLTRQMHDRICIPGKS
ncbi:MAG TPA: DUF1003 domain-containing protein [Patescibacteria group bacterium]|jgi:uncharacterized membrane protein|nr:DUF1003 domain-containing protein [Patescibacteria group bacterium]